MIRRETDPNQVWDEDEECSAETEFENDESMFLEIFLEDLEGGEEEDDLDEPYWPSERERRPRVDPTSRDGTRLRDDD